MATAGSWIDNAFTPPFTVVGAQFSAIVAIICPLACVPTNAWLHVAMITHVYLIGAFLKTRHQKPFQLVWLQKLYASLCAGTGGFGSPENLYPIAILVDELKNDDAALRLNAMKKIDTIGRLHDLLALSRLLSPCILVPFAQPVLPASYACSYCSGTRKDT
jgi:hypothetical protein